MRRGTASEKAIRAMSALIARKFSPNLVILFGSYARGQASSDSDVDLLVVMPIEGSRRDTQIEIRMALRDFKVPKDILVTTPEDYAWRKNFAGTIERPAAREGRVLYARK